MKSWTVGVVAVCFLASVLTGCGGGGPAGPALETVKGVVTYKDNAVEGAKVSFVLEGSSSSGSGQTDATGNFSFLAPVGTNGVSISKITLVDTGRTETQPSTDTANPTSVEKPIMDSKNDLPGKYSVITPTGLKETVKKGGPNDFKFNLTD